MTLRSLIIVSERSLVNFTENTVPALCDVKFADPDQHAFLSSVLWDNPFLYPGFILKETNQADMFRSAGRIIHIVVGIDHFAIV